MHANDELVLSNCDQALKRRLLHRMARSANHAHSPSSAEFARSVLIVGDRPGPSAPKDGSYHHTPFFSHKHCSGWLNKQLEIEGIDEGDLVWINAYDYLGNPHTKRLLGRTEKVICLGGNAFKWAGKGVKIHHPQYHKRFLNKERYPLFDLIHEYLRS